MESLNSPVDVRKIALAQRRLIQVILAAIAVALLGFAIDLTAEKMNWKLSSEIGVAGVLVSLALWCAEFAVVFSLGRALGLGRILYLYMAIMLVPYIALGVLLALNIHATQRLKDAGVRVGFLGVHPADLKRYTETFTDRHCPICGEKIPGDARRCPTCGAAV